ncbi:MAG: hypothetical protein Q4D26_03925 [Clostridia bacterium]|nr:hypothetical protein [Clostridia bacterium]
MEKAIDFFKHNSRVFMLIFILLAMFIAFFLILPGESYVYYNAEADKVSLSGVSDKYFDLHIPGKDLAGEIFFGASEDKIIKIINYDKIQESKSYKFDVNNYDEAAEFPFADGTATLLTNDDADLSLEMPEGVPFSYDIEIENKNNNQNNDNNTGCVNRVTIKNFPGDLKICIRNSGNINCKGDKTLKEMKPAKYIVYDCDYIQFDMYGSADIKYDTEKSIGLSENIDSFYIQNSEKAELEYTYNSNTEFKELGHLGVYGKAKDNNLKAEIKDLGQYPLPIKIEGRAGRLEIAGESVYLTLRQWITNNMTEIILAVLGIVFTDIITKKQSS